MDAVNKKKKKRANVPVDDEASLKYQTLLKEYLELQKENVSKKRKLRAAKKKKGTLLSEVGFLSQRRKYLSKSQALNIDISPLCLPNSGLEIKPLLRIKNHSTAEAAAPGNFDQVLLLNSPMKNAKAKQNEPLYGEDVRFTQKRKNSVGKRKVSWHDQVALKSR